MVGIDWSVCEQETPPSERERKAHARITDRSYLPSRSAVLHSRVALSVLSFGDFEDHRALVLVDEIVALALDHRFAHRLVLDSDAPAEGVLARRHVEIVGLDVVLIEMVAHARLVGTPGEIAM